MSENKVLIVYGSRYGATEEIALKMASELKKLSIQTNLINLKNIEQHYWPNITDYKAIIIGSSIKMGKWTKEIKKFIEINLDDLRKYTNPIGLFVTSGLASNPDRYEELKEDYIEKPLQKYHLSVTIFDVFAGVLDLTSSSKFSWLDKKIVNAMAKEDQSIKPKEKNDFRNWQKIIAFVDSYNDLLY